MVICDHIINLIDVDGMVTREEEGLRWLIVDCLKRSNKLEFACSRLNDIDANAIPYR